MDHIDTGLKKKILKDISRMKPGVQMEFKMIGKFGYRLQKVKKELGFVQIINKKRTCLKTSDSSEECCVCLETTKTKTKCCCCILCQTCLNKLRSNTCPMCRREFNFPISTFYCNGKDFRFMGIKI
jgi:hypothetical protein